MEQLHTILKAEEAFAREVALGVVVTRPLNGWFYLIPGMFIVDFIRRQAAIRNYVSLYMMPRRLALESAQRIWYGANPTAVREDMESQIGLWIASQGHRHPDLINVQMALVELLLTHFGKLLEAPNQDYHQMVRSAYRQRSQLRRMLDRLNELEFQRNRLLSPTAKHIQTSLYATQGQVEMRRKRLVDAIY